LEIWYRVYYFDTDHILIDAPYVTIDRVWSVDGVNWSTPETILNHGDDDSNGNYLSPSMVVFEGGYRRMWYNNTGGYSSDFRVLESFDYGETWENMVSCTTPDQDGLVPKLPDGKTMWHSQVRYNENRDEYWCLCLSFFNDGAEGDYTGGEAWLLISKDGFYWRPSAAANLTPQRFNITLGSKTDNGDGTCRLGRSSGDYFNEVALYGVEPQIHFPTTNNVYDVVNLVSDSAVDVDDAALAEDNDIEAWMTWQSRQLYRSTFWFEGTEMKIIFAADAAGSEYRLGLSAEGANELVRNSVTEPTADTPIVRYVSPTGDASWSEAAYSDEPCSIETAMANATDGAIVYLKAGTYSPAATLDPDDTTIYTEPVQFIGCNSDWSLPEVGERPAIIDIGEGAFTLLQFASGDYSWHFHNIQFLGNTSYNGYLILDGATQANQFHNCLMANARRSNLYGQAGDGAILTNCELYNNILSSYALFMVLGASATLHPIMGCYFHDAPAAAIELDNDVGAGALVIQDTKFESIPGTCIQTDWNNSDECQIIFERCYFWDVGSIVKLGQDSAVTRNMVIVFKDCVIWAPESTGLVIEGSAGSVGCRVIFDNCVMGPLSGESVWNECFLVTGRPTVRIYADPFVDADNGDFTLNRNTLAGRTALQAFQGGDYNGATGTGGGGGCEGSRYWIEVP
jgi:hypothetical protein